MKPRDWRWWLKNNYGPHVNTEVVALVDERDAFRAQLATLTNLADQALDGLERYSAGFRPKWSSEEWYALRDALRAAVEDGAIASKPAPQTEPLFYVQDTREVVGNCASWWCPNGAGYTCELGKAGLYTAKGRDWRDTDKLWPRDVIEQLAVKHVRVEHLRAAERLLPAHEGVSRG